MAGFTAQHITDLISLTDVQVSPDGTSVIFAETTMNSAENRYESALRRCATATGELTTISPSGFACSLGRWSPNGTVVACTLRALGDDDAVTKLALIDIATLEVTEICTPPEGPTELAWSPDGSTLAFVARDPDLAYYAAPGESREPKDTPARKIERFYSRLDGEGWLFDRPSRAFTVAARPGATLIARTLGPFDVNEISWSPDGCKIAFASARHTTWDLDLLRDLWVLDLATEAVGVITPTDSMYASPIWSPDSERIAAFRYATPLAGPCHNHVVVIDLGDQTQRTITSALDRNCTPPGNNRLLLWQDPDHLLFAYENRGSNALAQANIRSTEIVDVVSGDRCVIDFDSRAGVLATIVGDASSLPELFVNHTQCSTITQQFQTATQSEAAIPIAYTATSTDGEVVDCWAIRPDGTGPFPTILNIHGGPFTQYTHKLFDEFQTQVAAGFAVLYCNPRGSAGYSEAWGRAVRWPECEVDPGTGWGGIDFDDVMACVDTAVARFDWIDGTRLGIQGGSYGGYLTTWIVGHTDRFRAACSERSVNNLITEEHNSDVATSFIEQVGASHLDAREAYVRCSPMTYVRNINTPMLILHSENDLRCPIDQAEELFVALRLLGKTPEFWRFPGEGHELSRSGAPKHRVQRAEIILDFFARNLM